MRIELTPYNSDWEKKFSSEKILLQNALHKFNPEIEHIGSTAVKGLAAKPIIDIQIGLNCYKDLDNAIPLIINLGYIYVKKYEDMVPLRRYFIKLENPMEGNIINEKDEMPHHANPRLFHIHMVEKSSDWFKRHIVFRDLLRKNVRLCKEYEQLKYNLSLNDWDNMNDYAEAKRRFIRAAEKLSA